MGGLCLCEDLATRGLPIINEQKLLTYVCLDCRARGNAAEGFCSERWDTETNKRDREREREKVSVASRIRRW